MNQVICDMDKHIEDKNVVCSHMHCDASCKLNKKDCPYAFIPKKGEDNE